jgi:exodeoxyribonuclease V gamma subunit
VSLDQLVEFFRNPCRYLLRRRLGVALSRAVDELQDNEPFLPDARARSALARRLMPALLQGADDRALQRLAAAGTEMPKGAIGEQQTRRELQALQDFAARVRGASEEPCLPPHTLDLEFELDGETWQFHAAFADLRASGLLRWHYGERRAGDYLEAWLHHLALCADAPTGVTAHTRWLWAVGESRLLPCAQALSRLRELLVLYRRGLCEPLRFFPRAAWQYVQHGRGQARAAWLTTRDRAFGEDADPAYRLALRGIAEPLDADFEAHATDVFGPLLQYLDEAWT